MECNKDEALRAKALAERKMLGNDFAGARKMISKAQKLSPELDNISKMLTVCEVHCAAGTKVAGETDWYGVLQVPPFTADAMLIKRQYRELALLLHPDKNKFAGAEAAFKLVGEANATLTDSSKRSVYDMNRKASVRFGAVAAGSPRAYQQPWRAGPARPNTTPVHHQHQHQHHSSASAGSQSQTCWSICLVCGIRCQTFGLYCSNCKDKQGMPYGANQQSSGVYNNAGPPQNYGGPWTGVAGQQALNHATPWVHASFRVPNNFPDGQQASYYATPEVQVKPGTRKSMYNAPPQHRARAPNDAAARRQWHARPRCQDGVDEAVARRAAE